MRYLLAMKSILDFKDYRLFIRSSIEAKLSVNSNLSLRSVAEKMALSPSYLSRVLSGQRKISLDSAGKVARYFNLSADEALYFFNLVELDNTKDEKERARLLKNLQNESHIKFLSADQFKLVSDWYHFAILSYARSKKFKSDIHWLSHRLDITPSQTQKAIERLLAAGLLKIENKKYKAVENAEFQTTQDIPSHAIRENHIQHLRLAEKSLMEFEPELREFINRTLNLNTSE